MSSEDIAPGAQALMVCLGADCLRLALGIAPQHFDAEKVRELINRRIDQYFEAQASPQPKDERER